MTTLARLQTILAKNFPLQREALVPEAPLEQLQIDSLGVMELLFAIEDEFRLKVPDDRRSFRTIGDLVACIDQLSAGQHGRSAAGDDAT